MKDVEFKYDKNGKCLNPEVFYTSRGKFVLKYPAKKDLFFEIKVCERGGRWAINCIYPGQEYPWSAAIYTQKGLAIEAAIYYLAIQAKTLSNMMPLDNKDRMIIKSSLAFLKWTKEVDVPDQLGLF